MTSLFEGRGVESQAWLWEFRNVCKHVQSYIVKQSRVDILTCHVIELMVSTKHTFPTMASGPRNITTVEAAFQLHRCLKSKLNTCFVHCAFCLQCLSCISHPILVKGLHAVRRSLLCWPRRVCRMCPCIQDFKVDTRVHVLCLKSTASTTLTRKCSWIGFNYNIKMRMVSTSF